MGLTTRDLEGHNKMTTRHYGCYRFDSTASAGRRITSYSPIDFPLPIPVPRREAEDGRGLHRVNISRWQPKQNAALTCRNGQIDHAPRESNKVPTHQVHVVMSIQYISTWRHVITTVPCDPRPRLSWRAQTWIILKIPVRIQQKCIIKVFY